MYDKVVELLTKADVIGYALDGDLSCNEAVSWNSYEDDMREISIFVPDVLFCLHGEGDQNTDIWEQYFLNGKSQECPAEIVIPPFDPDKLS